MKIAPLSPKHLRWRCPEDAFDFETTSDVTPTEKIVTGPALSTSPLVPRIRQVTDETGRVEP